MSPLDFYDDMSTDGNVFADSNNESNQTNSTSLNVGFSNDNGGDFGMNHSANSCLQSDSSGHGLHSQSTGHGTVESMQVHYNSGFNSCRLCSCLEFIADPLNNNLCLNCGHSSDQHH